jgi:putative Mn2+ efflux pump MntP
MTHVLIVAGVLVPLSVDTFALGAALGIVGLQPRERLRTSIILAAFEGGMPVLGFLLGGAIGQVLGRFAGYTAIAFLVLAGVLLLRSPGDDAEEHRLRLLARARGLAVIDLGLSISVDEMAIGLSLGLLGISPPLAVIWIAVQAFLAAQLGMRLGARIGEAWWERAEQLAGAALIAMAGLLLILRLIGRF